VFAAPPVIKAEVFARLPEALRAKGMLPNVLEGPSFDRDGNLYLVDIHQGRVLKLTMSGKFSVVAEYDGEPNGLRIHQDGRIFIADHKRGLLLLDPAVGAVTTLIDRPRLERFKGLNDLIFDSRGNLFFTDQGESGLHDPSGRLWCLEAVGQLRLLLDNIPSPNGLVPALGESVLYLAVTRANAVWRVPLLPDMNPGRVGLFVQMSGGTGPDGMALDEEGNLVVAHVGLGSVWVFSNVGRPIAEIRGDTGPIVTNVAFGGTDRKTLYITGSDTVMTVQMTIPGRRMFSHH
jgi:gluconolactonase